MSRTLMTLAVVLIASACAAPATDVASVPASPTVPMSEPMAPSKMGVGAKTNWARPKINVEPHAKFPSDWRVQVVEPMEIQVGPGRFMSAPHSLELINGDRISRWPIYGAISMQPN